MFASARVAPRGRGDDFYICSRWYLFICIGDAAYDTIAIAIDRYCAIAIYMFMRMQQHMHMIMISMRACAFAYAYEFNCSARASTHSYISLRNNILAYASRSTSKQSRAPWPRIYTYAILAVSSVALLPPIARLSSSRSVPIVDLSGKHAKCKQRANESR